MKNDRYSGKIKLEFFGKVQEYFKIYRDNKQELDHRIIDNNRWYKSRYNSDPDAVIPEPTTDVYKRQVLFRQCIQALFPAV